MLSHNGTRCYISKIFILFILGIAVFKSAHASQLDTALKEFSISIKKINQIKADNDLSFEQKSATISALFWQTIQSSERNSSAKVFLTSYNGFNTHTKALLLATINFYLEENRSYLAKDIIQYGIDFTRDNVFILEHIKLITTMGNIYTSIGLYEQCRTLYESGNSFFEEETQFLSLDDDNDSAHSLERRHNRLQLVLLKLKCYDFNFTSNSEDIVFWQSKWVELKILFESDRLISFIFPKFFSRQYTILAMWQAEDFKQYAVFYPKNTELLYELFQYFCRVHDKEAANEVRQLLMTWLEHNKKINHTTEFFNATNTIEGYTAYNTLNDFEDVLLSKLDTELALSRVTRMKLLAPYYKHSIDAQWYLLNEDNELSLKATESLLDSLKIIEKSYDDEFGIEIKAADTIYLKVLNSRAMRALALERTSKFVQAAALFEKNIRWAELNRDKIPLKQRKFFFRSYLRKSYVGSYRNRALSFKESPESRQKLELFLASGDKLRSRQLKDKRGIKSNEINYVLNAQQTLFISADLSTHILSFWQNNKGVFIDVIPKPIDWDKSIYKLREQIVSRQDINEELFNSITKPLIAPFKKGLTKAKNIYTLIDGALSVLPMSYLLLDKFDSANSLTTIQYIANLNHIDSRQETISLKNTSFLAIADPIYDQQASLNFIYKADLPNLSKTRSKSLQGAFTALPETRAEVEAIASMIHGEKKLLFGAQASKEMFIKEVSKGYQIIHFATHGILGGELPDINEPALVLTPNVNNDGLLLASEIEGLSLNAEVVILSACNTGSGEYFYGEEIQGLAKAFALAGTKNLLVSLWPVDSDSTVRVMVAFYKYLSDGEPVEYALAKAQQDVFNNTVDDSSITRGLKRVNKSSAQAVSKHPYYWAPFILIKAN